MAVLTAQDFSNQMIAQLRVLDPSVSALVGTPERKIIDTVAQALADTQVDLTGLAGGMDIDSKYGSNLDRFTALFGFSRQAATTASGYVVFSRNTPAPADITIPTGTTIQSNVDSGDAGVALTYVTTAGGTIDDGETTSDPVPIACVVSGSGGNAGVATLTILATIPVVAGVTSVTNPAPITGGNDVEDDNSYKARFKNTVFRNMAGTMDQYLALAVSTTFTTKANVIGPVSQYNEYLQVPDFDDAGYVNGVQIASTVSGGGQTFPGTTLVVASTTGFPSAGIIYVTGVAGPVTYTNTTGGNTFTGCTGGSGTAVSGGAVVFGGAGGQQNSWTTALSAIPYAQDIYVNNPLPFVQTSETSALGVPYFFQDGTDFLFNYPPLITGDAFRESQNAGTVAPNWTFLNVYNPVGGAAAPAGLTTPTPGSILLVEYSYLSGASRNSIQHNVYNAVDVYVDGSNPTQASCVFLPNVSQFTANPTAALYVENFRRDGEPATRPHIGNFFTPLLNTPLTALPSTITVGTQNYYLGEHYWLIHDVGPLHGSIRARDGIEWSNFLGADAGNQTPSANPLAPYTTTGATINNQGTGTVVEVDSYDYDANIVVLQASMEQGRQITTDVLTHTAKTRYFKVDITVMYSPNANISVTNAAIGTALSAYMTNQYFGTVIQLSDLLDVVHQVSGVDNVRWSNDLPTVPNLMRVIETDINGNPLHLPTIDRLLAGTVSTLETQQIYIPGGGYSPVANFGVADSFQLNWNDTINAVTFTTPNIYFDTLSASAIQTAIQANAPGSGLYHGITVLDNSTVITNPLYPIASFQIQYNVNGAPFLPSVSSTSIVQSPYAYDSDFFLRDDELPSVPIGTAATDTVPGAIIRPRAQNTFVRPGIG